MGMFVACTVPALEKTIRLENTSRKALKGVYSFTEALEHCGWIHFAIAQFLDEGILDTGNTGLKGCKQEKSELVGGRASRPLFNAWGITSVIFWSSDELFALI